MGPDGLPLASGLLGTRRVTANHVDRVACSVTSKRWSCFEYSILVGRTSSTRMVRINGALSTTKLWSNDISAIDVRSTPSQTSSAAETHR